MTPYFRELSDGRRLRRAGSDPGDGDARRGLGASPYQPTTAKHLTYECGVDPVGSGWNQTYIRYYVYGLLFVIFDVEAVFIFPWAIVLERLGTFGLVEMFIFIDILILGLVYAIRKGVLRWE